MRLIWISGLLLLVVLVVLTGGCAGGEGEPTGAAVDPAAPGALSGFPAVPPPGEVRQARYAPEPQVKISAQFLAVNPANVTDLGVALEFVPMPEGPPEEKYAWAVYDFTLPDYTGPLTVSLDWLDMADLTNIWIGIYNWTDAGWEWQVFDEYIIDLPQRIPSLGKLDYIDPLSNRACVATVVGGAATRYLYQVSFGAIPWEGWDHSIGGDDGDFIADLDVNGDGWIVSAGQTWSYGQGSGDCLLTLYDSQGNLQWCRAWGTENNEEYSGVCFHDGAIYCTGRYDPTGEGFGDILAQRWSMQGELEAGISWGGVHDDQATSIESGPGGGVYISGSLHLYQEDPWRDDSDAIVLKLSDDLSTVIYDFQFGAEVFWERAAGLAFPPDLWAEDRFVVASNEYSDSYFTGQISPRLSLGYDLTGTGEQTMRLTSAQSARINEICTRENGRVCAGGFATTLAGQDVGLVLRYYPRAEDPADALEEAVTCSPPGPDNFCEITGLQWYGGTLYGIATTGITLWPDFDVYSLFFMLPDGDWLDPFSAVWGSDGNDCGLGGLRLSIDGENVTVNMAGNGRKSHGHWFLEDFDWAAYACSLTEESIDFAPSTGTSLRDAPGTAVDLNSLIEEDDHTNVQSDGLVHSFFFRPVVKF